MPLLICKNCKHIIFQSLTNISIVHHFQNLFRVLSFVPSLFEHQWALGKPDIFFSVKKLLKTSTCPIPIISTAIDSPIDQYITRLLSSSANIRPCASRSLKWVWSSRTSLKLSYTVCPAVSIYTKITKIHKIRYSKYYI